MAATTYPEFNDKTEGLDVAKAFAQQIRGKTVLVTGVNKGGIGFSTAQAFASQSPAHLIIAGRNPSKLEASINALKADYPNIDYRPLKLDLSTQKAVRAGADELLSWSDVPAIDIVVNSAGIMNIPERTINEDGTEITFATNHIGHFLFTSLIMPKLLKAAENNPKGSTRIINVTSGSPQVAKVRWRDMNFEIINKDLPEDEQPPYMVHKMFGVTDSENKAYVPIEAYNQSKVANVLFSVGINNRLFDKHGILSLAVHPGRILTELSRDAAPETRTAIEAMSKNAVFAFKTLGGGAATSLVAATDPKLGKPSSELVDGKENHGVWLMDCQITDKAAPLAVSSAEADRLWDYSEGLVHEKFAW